MAEDSSSSKSMSPLSSFSGRLDIQNFKFTAETQPGIQKNITTPRFSERLTSRIDKRFKPTKPDANRNTSSSGTKSEKRKAVTAEWGLCEEGHGAITSTKRKKLRKVLTDRQSPISDRKNVDVTVPGDDGLDMTTTQKKKQKRIRANSGYAPPSTFAHLPPLPDAMAPNAFVLFCGLNPGIQTAISGHAYSNPTNRFWKIMHSSGVLPVPCTPDEDRTLPTRFRLGLTNIVERPSRNGAQLSKAEMDAGVPVLEAKVRRWRPEVICLVGKSIWESVWRVHHGGKAVGKAFNEAFEYGWQDEAENMGVGHAIENEDGVVYADDWKGARVFVASSTSGLAATLSPAEKERIWRKLGVWVEKRRAQAQAANEKESRDKAIEEEVASG